MPLLPSFPTFSPSKAFLMSSSMELAREMKVTGRGIEVIGLRAGGVAGTGMNRGKEGFFRPGVDKFVEAALARVGCGRMVVIPYWPHAVMAWWRTLLPEFVREFIYADAVQHRYRQQ
ncbi:Uu.00g114760.m01.CDS01 [Anthostomella pinea]|uniref:Uu.00g114760.m01.CDS01 n=1 Tax=Anthostomella pinea TaxID=933095 RepID=A0AAI8YGT7_9PEZI|nr:Uu.00g114760.m01.CDS01 [Anthostomella pinea]